MEGKKGKTERKERKERKGKINKNLIGKCQEYEYLYH